MDPNADDRVRPVPIEPGDAEASRGLDVEADPARPDRARRPWLPLAIAASAVGIVFVSITAFGALQFEDPERPSAESFASDFVAEDEESVTTTTLPPSLEELIPGVRDRLTIITHDADSVWAVLWDPAFRVPNQEQIKVPDNAVLAGMRASFDRSGQFVAVNSCPNGECFTLIGTPTDVRSESQFSSAHFTWHASEVGRIAWTEFVEGTTVIFTATANPVTGGLEDVEEAFRIDGITELHRFDSSGFIVRNDYTRAFDHEGNVVWEVEGIWPASSNDSIVSVVTPDMEWITIDRSTGAPLGEQRLTGSLQDTAFWVSTTEDTDLIVRIAGDPASGRFSMTVVGGGMRAPRIKSFDDPLSPLRFTRNGQYFVFTNSDDSELVFVDWWNGAEYTVPMPPGHRFIDFHLG